MVVLSFHLCPRKRINLCRARFISIQDELILSLDLKKKMVPFKKSLVNKGKKLVLLQRSTRTRLPKTRRILLMRLDFVHQVNRQYLWRMLWRIREKNGLVGKKYRVQFAHSLSTRTILWAKINSLKGIVWAKKDEDF